MNDTIIKTTFIQASVETVWEYLTDKNKLGEWFHPAQANLEQGKNYQLVGADDDGTPTKKCWGVVLESEKPNRLVYTFTIEPLGGIMTTVTWLLEPLAGGTRLTLQHEGLGQAAGDGVLPLIMALDAGWDAHLSKLRIVGN